MNHLLSQALNSEFPAAPDFEAEVKTSNLKKVHQIVSEATQAPAADAPLPSAVPLCGFGTLLLTMVPAVLWPMRGRIR